MRKLGWMYTVFPTSTHFNVLRALAAVPKGLRLAQDGRYEDRIDEITPVIGKLSPQCNIYDSHMEKMVGYGWVVKKLKTVYQITPKGKEVLRLSQEMQDLE